MRIERVIEIEHPGLDRAEAANPFADPIFHLTLDHSGDSLLPYFKARWF